MPEALIAPQGADELKQAIEAALTAWFDAAEVTTSTTAAGVVTAAVRWPAAGTWRRLVDEHVIPVSEGLYRAGARVVDGRALADFLDGVRSRLVEQSTLIDDIKAAQQRYGDAAASIDWTGAGGDALPWRSRAALIGGHEAQVTSMQSATDSNPGARKRWRSRHDDRVRSSHREADGQAVGLDAPFRVGGAELMYPGDPRGPVGEVLNCRCEMYLITPQEGDTVAASGLTAAAAVHTGAMAALLPSEADAERLAIPGGERADELHCTLYYLGDAAPWSEEQRTALIDHVRRNTRSLAGPVVGNAFGINEWNPSSEDPAWVWAVSDRDGAPLADARQAVSLALDRVDGPEIPEQHSPWVAHVTAVYASDDAPRAPMTERLGPITFDRIRVAFAGNNTDIPLAEPGEETLSASTLTAAVSVDTDLPFAPRDTAWDGAAAQKALREWATNDAGEVDEDKLARGYVWRTDGPPSDWKLPVAQVSDGNLELVWDGVVAAAGAAQGARSPLDLPAGDVDKVKAALGRLYAKAAEAFDDDSIAAPWDRETEASLAISAILRTLPADASPRSVVASLEQVVNEVEQGAAAAVRRQIMASALSSAIDDAQQALPGGDDGGPWTPPADWFTPPDGSQTELISPEGRVAGYVATWNDVDGAPMCHAGYAGEGECQTVPKGGDYGYFHQGNVTLTLDDGSKVHPGLLTTDIGHGPSTPFVDQQVAHYDNPQAIAAAVIVGEDDKGIWMSGAVLPQVMRDEDKFTRLRLTPVSGHWSETQPGGPLELIAVTSVNKPGYPQRSTSGYQLAASIAGSEVSDLQMFRAQLAEMLTTVDTILEGGAPDGEDVDPDELPLEDVPASAAGGEQPDVEKVTAAYPEGVDRELVDAARSALPDVEKMTAKDLTAAALPGISLPKCLQILSDFLEGEGTDSQHSRAAAVKAAESICRSTDVRNAAVRARACRLVSEYRVKAGKR